MSAVTNTMPLLVKAPPMVTTVNSKSAKKVCGSSDQVIIYGWRHCQYETVATLIAEHMQTVHTYLTLRYDKSIKKVLPNVDGVKQVCKENLTNIVYTNYLRKMRNEPVIPVLFLIDISRNPFPYNPDEILSRDAKLNNFVTHAELRRIYKLCCELEKEGHGEIARAAKETFKFAKVVVSKKSARFRPVNSFWEQPDWDAQWEARKLTKPKHPARNKPNWKSQLIKEVRHAKIMNAAKTVAQVALLPVMLGLLYSRFAQ